MCTAVLLRRPGYPWPVVFAANRDEMKTRPWRPPGRHWPNQPGVVAGLDETAGGAWLGLNQDGVLAGVLNRLGSLGPAADKRSRGELVLKALENDSATAAATGICHLDPEDYRSFNMVIADRKDAFWLRNLGDEHDPERGPGRIEAFELPPGLSMITARDRNDPASPRIRANMARFEAAEPPDPGTGRWTPWKRIVKSRKHRAADGPESAMTVATNSGFETVSSSLIALPGLPQSLRGNPPEPVWLFAPGRPDETPYEMVAL